MKVLPGFLAIFFFLFSSLYPQINSPKKTTVITKAPKYIITTMVSYNYAFSANNDVLTFSESYDPLTGKHYFNSSNYAIQFGVGILTEGKVAVDKKRRLRLTGELSYNHFYNTRDGGLNRTRWQFFNIGAGIEYNLKPKSKSTSFIGGELLYTLMWGAWQTNIIYPDGYESNIYLKFNPASRFGAALKTGMEFRMTKNTTFLVGLRGVWANIAPKENSYASSAYTTYINDSGNNGGISLGNPKQVVFLQLLTGINFQIRK